MTIGNRVKECIDKLNSGDLENALIQLSIAFDGTAKKEYPKTAKVGERFKAFLRDNQDIITYFTFSGNMFIDCKFNGYTIEEIIYKVLRCGLLHEGSIPDEIEFIDEIRLGRNNGRWCFPKTYIQGGLLAVIGAESNKAENIPAHYSTKINRKIYKVNDLWGRRDKIRKIMMEYISEL